MKVSVFYNRQGLQDCAILVTEDGRSAVVNDVSTDKQLARFFTREGMLPITREMLDALSVRTGFDLKNYSPSFVVGQILKFEGIEGTKLNKCFVNAGGSKYLTIVCGASNVQVGKKVVVALPGAILPAGQQIVEAPVMGVSSEGMMCSAAELGLPPDASRTIMFLDQKAPVGSEYVFGA